MTKAYEHFDNIEDVLYSAEKRVKNEWEMDFVDGLKEKFSTYGDDMFLSEKQASILRRIIGDE
jgi:hypothetical protein